MVMVVSEDDGFTWTPPKWTNIWGYPPELIALQDGRYLMIYGYRRPPYGVRGIISDDGVTWDVKNEFVIREGGVPGTRDRAPGLEPHDAGVRQDRRRRHRLEQPRRLPAHRLSERGADAGRHDRRSYHEWSDDPKPLAICALHALPAALTPLNDIRRWRLRRVYGEDHQIIHRDPHAYSAHPHLAAAGQRQLAAGIHTARRRAGGDPASTARSRYAATC